MGDLKFDKMDVDTKLAEEYLKKNNYTFGHDGSTDEFVEDTFKNKVYLSKTGEKSSQVSLKNMNFRNVSLSLKKLENKLEENVELFAQLDFLIRGYSPNDIKKFDMKLLIRLVQICYDTISEANDRTDEYFLREYGTFVISEDKSLLQLGELLHLLIEGVTVNVTATINVAAVSFLFSQLCNEVGFTNNMNITFLKSCVNETVSSQWYGANFRDGCIGVISEMSDMDSAIDAFLSSLTKANYPFTLRRVLVQENVYQTFKGVMKWKCAKDTKETDLAIKSACSETFLYGENTFLLDFVGDEIPSNCITVEAYRTVKELLMLLKKYDKMKFLSLWCSDISEANEIAYGVDMSVWINDIGYFDGPAKLLYTILHPFASINFSNYDNTWIARDINERRKILSSLINDPVVKNSYADLVPGIKRKLLNHTNKSVDIQNNRIYVVKEKYQRNACEDGLDCLRNLHLLLYADMIISNRIIDKHLFQLYDKYRIPISNKIFGADFCRPYITFIITNFGTTFAN